MHLKQQLKIKNKYHYQTKIQLQHRLHKIY